MRGYDSWKTAQPDEPSPKAKCDCCGDDLYEGDYIFTVNGENLCMDCLNDNYRRML